MLKRRSTAPILVLTGVTSAENAIVGSTGDRGP